MLEIVKTDRIQCREAGSEWMTLDPIRREDDCVAFMMDSVETDYVTFDTSTGKVEYRRVREVDA